jgi:tellurite resistance protein TehA-like permease
MQDREASTKPYYNTKVLGYVVSGASGILFIANIVCFVFSYLCMRDRYEAERVFYPVFFFHGLLTITSILGIVSGIPKVFERDQYVLTVFTLAGHVSLLVSVYYTCATIYVGNMSSIGNEYKLIHNFVFGIYGVATVLLIPTVAVTGARVDLFRRE